MLKFLWFLRGYVILEICGAAPGWALNKLTEGRVAFWNIRWVDSLTVRICVFRSKAKEAAALAVGAMCDCRVVQNVGLRQSLGGIFHRPVLVVTLLLSMLSIVVLPKFVFFYEVVGNDTVPEQEILRELNTLGIGFGQYGPNIHPQWVKDHLVNTLPELQWVTVTQNGCRAQVVVRERIPTPETSTRKGFSNIIATQSGIITQQSVLAGQPQFKVGDTVSRGDVLVSGIVDLERIYVIENARAEIFARTWRNKTVSIPSSYTEKADQTEKRCCIWLVIGRKRIKIFGNSGISYGTCDKMIAIKKLELPEELEIPVQLEIETFRIYEPKQTAMEQEAAKTLLSAYVEQTVLQQMQAGQILRQSYSLDEQNGCYSLQAALECHEMIAETDPAKWNNEEIVND